MQVYVTAEGDGKEAITRYHVLHSNGHYSLLELDLETGRKNQIRVRTADASCPTALLYSSGDRGRNAFRNTYPGCFRFIS